MRQRLFGGIDAMHADGMLALETEAIECKFRKYYSITPKGRTVLDGIRPTLAELAEEVRSDSSLERSTSVEQPPLRKRRVR